MPRYRFGDFEFDPQLRELSEKGSPRAVPVQTAKLLQYFLETDGRVVTRAEIQALLWPEGVNVNFEAGINTAIRRLRQLLGDEHEGPMYLATLAGSGYRFLMPVDKPEEARGPDAHPGRGRGPWWLAAVVFALALADVAGWAYLRLSAPPRVLDIRALTTDGGMDLPARPATDGTYLYYLDRAGGHWNLVRSPGRAAEAETLPLAWDGQSVRLMDVSRDHAQWLLGSFSQRGEAAALWRMPAGGSVPERLGDLRALDAVWSPDGTHIFYGFDGALWTALADGTQPQRLAKAPSTPDWLTWSPDGSRLVFNSSDGTTQKAELWEWRRGAGAHPLPFPQPRCCGTWSRDGRYFFFSVQDQDRWNLWARRQTAIWPAPAPVQLEALAGSSFGAFTGFGQDQVVFYHRDLREDPSSYAPASGKLEPLLVGRSALQVVYSPKRDKLAYVDSRDQTLWRAAVGKDGRARSFVRLTAPGRTASLPVWSPDGNSLAFVQDTGGRQRLFRIAATGGGAQALLPAAVAANVDVILADWSPDGQSLVVSVAEHSGGAVHTSLALLRSGRLLPVPGSQGLEGARWSPDGQWLAAASSDQKRLELYNLRQQRWQQAGAGRALADPLWSRDGWLYYQDLLAEGEPLFRLRPGGQPQRVAEFSALLAEGVHRCGFSGFTPNGDLLLSLNRSHSDLYAARLQLP